MPTQTLNIIYDTNYTNIINWWGFVDHQFSSVVEKSTWNIEVTQPWNQTDNTHQNTNQTENTPTSNQQQWQKTPWFLDLLFWPLNSQNTKNNTNWNQESNINQSQIQTQPIQVQTQTQPVWVVSTVAQNVATWQQVWTAVAAQTQNVSQPTWATELSETPKNVKKKSWLDSMLDNVFWTDEWSKKTKNTEETWKWSVSDNKPTQDTKKQTEQERKANELREQVRKILEIPDAEYKDSMITSDMRRFIKQVDEEYTKNISDFKSHIAPSYWEYKSNLMNISW